MFRYLLLVILFDIFYIVDILSLGFLEKLFELFYFEFFCIGLMFGGFFLFGIFIYFYLMDINLCKLFV